MLVLSRKPGESLRIGDDITITYLGVNAYNNTQIRLGITAPKTVPVHREEIYDKIHGENNANEDTL